MIESGLIFLFGRKRGRGWTYVENASDERLLLLVQCDAFGSFNVCVLNVEIGCVCNTSQH